MKTHTKQALVAYNIVQKINAFLVKVGVTTESLITERVHGVYLADFRRKPKHINMYNYLNYSHGPLFHIKGFRKTKKTARQNNNIIKPPFTPTQPHPITRCPCHI